ncbi:uncharacterized protein PGTG_15479 [Puccinia graminis f. sp. tritici CRL 75-36-700-3]|uniref:J domain-containing protein n=1 Tax=Puccinia graminis f. sp. tritici (strain CRL 75-36-700-3 / race SCCL) TaxID=418459 RepID=E3KYA9_PUCGT|nr:uncharacterized protein PGTG_15479 [Puccinia graminis f. sp. tritici CRL 75-36-700-3]EFP89300.1 hypothetical protein PGTG_15479 [Puccinia graminis f. sp. tritici CRL 75-36-700-3]
MATTNGEDAQEIENILKGEESLLTREQEVERVVAAFKLNPYEILDLDMTNPTAITESVIRKTYRQKSLLIHPDKLSHPRGVEAFDLLKKAEGFLLDPEKRKGLDETIKDARMLTLRRLNLPDSTPDEHEKLAKLVPSFQFRVGLKTKEIIIEEELRVRRARKMTMIAEGTEAKRQEDAIPKRKPRVEREEEVGRNKGRKGD